MILDTVQRAGQWVYGQVLAVMNRGFGTELNPFHYLGALTIFFFWIVLVSGIWLLVFFRTSVGGAFESVEYLTHDQWYFGGIMRSLHRYASDAAVVTLVLHIIREFVFDHYRGKRWFSWVTGVPLLWIVVPLGLTGYWLVWDQLAQQVALSSAELLDWLPIFTGSMARNFLSDEAVSDRFFTLMAFLHLIGLPLFLVFGIWLHVFRISGPRINPPRMLMAGTLLLLVVLSVVYPALSQGKANLAIVPQSLGLDWYYLLYLPMMKYWSPGTVWAVLSGFSMLLFLAPWLPPAGRPAVAKVDLDNCNGCQRCADDCPYGAIIMQPRSDGLKYEQEAVVDADLCVSCGICVGACPTATPFRKASALVPGIDLPDLSAALLREQIESAAGNLSGDQRVMVFGCAGSRGLRALEGANTVVVSVQCMAHLPPSYVDYVISRDLAHGVVLAGCAGGGCQYRLGDEWTRQRMQRQRDPYLRKRIDEQRLALAWDDHWSRWSQPAALLTAFRQKLSGLQSGNGAATHESGSGDAVHYPIALAALKIRPRKWPVQVVAYALFALAASAFSAWPALELIEPDQAMVSLTFSHAGQRVRECRRLSQQELNALPPNMRKLEDCVRERRPLRITFQADGTTLYDELVAPSGFWDDGESTVYARFVLPAGGHRLLVAMNDSGKEQGYDYQLETEMDLQPGQHVVVEFDHQSQSFVMR